MASAFRGKGECPFKSTLSEGLFADFIESVDERTGVTPEQ